MLLAAVALLAAAAAGAGGARGPHALRRSVAAMPPPSLPMSKGGWRPVVGSGGFPTFSIISAAPISAPKYKIPIPVSVDSYPTASKQQQSREPNKLTSIAQSYKPTTLRSLQMSNINAPVNSYHNPFSLPNGGLSHYKIVQNYPMESVVIRNPNGPYQARPVFKQNVQGQNKFKPLNVVMQQLGNSYHYYPTTVRNPQDPFSKPVEVYVRPTEGSKKPEVYGRPEAPKKASENKKPEGYKHEGYRPETYKLEVYKVADNAGASQSVSPQQVKTAQQALAAGTLKPPSSMTYQQYSNYKEEKFSPIPASVLGSFGTFGIPSVKVRDPVTFGTKTTYLPPAPTKHTVFNSFSYTPIMQQDKFITTTPKANTSPNQIVFGNYVPDVRNQQTQVVKQNVFKVDTAQPNKVNFKASPQDPFAKPGAQTQFVSNKQPQQVNVYHPLRFSPFPQYSTYFTTLPPTTSQSIYNTKPLPNRFVSQLNPAYTTFSTFYGHHAKPLNANVNVHSVTPTVTIQNEIQYSGPVKDKLVDATPQTVPFRATYDVTETYDIETQPPRGAWLQSHDEQQQQPPTHEAATYYHSGDSSTDLPRPDRPAAQYTFVTEPNDNKQYDNSLVYETDPETQSRPPLGDDFEDNQYIGKHKLKDHYYKVTTPTSVDSSTRHIDYEVTTRRHHYREHGTRGNEKDSLSDQLPTLPPNKHFRRPHPMLELTEKDRNRKKNKNRRRRPTQTTPSEHEEAVEATTAAPQIEVYTTEPDGTVHTVKPRIRVPIYGKPKTTTPTVTTDLSTSALPTLSPTTPTVVIRKKLSGRRTTTLPPNEEEYTTVTYKNNDLKTSSIMKIANRPGQRITHTYESNMSETPDYSHKQDEKDTPTSDISVNIDVKDQDSSDDSYKPFDFHVNVKPIDNKLELHPTTQRLEAPQVEHVTHDDFDNKESDKDDDIADLITTTPRVENTTLPGKLQRPRIKNKYENNRPRFSVKDYRNRMSSTTTTERSYDVAPPKLRFPQRRLPVYNDNKIDSDNSTEAPRKKFTPKEPRHKAQGIDATAPEVTTEKHSFSTRSSIRHRVTQESSTAEPSTTKISSRIRTNGRTQSRGKPSTNEEQVEQSSPGTVHIKRPQRKKIKEADSLSEGTEDVAVTESSRREEPTSERQRSESAIMKIAKEDRKPPSGEAVEHSLSEHSRRVSDLTLAASKDYNTPGMFKTVSPNSRRIPSYFTIATDDPILPIEAFFPQLNQKKDS